MTDAEFDAAIAALAPWVGRTRIVEDEIGLSSARRIAGMLDMDPASITQGMALPPHWFTMFFPDIADCRLNITRCSIECWKRRC